MCRECGQITHIDSLPDGTSECPDCGGKLYQRADDAPEAVAQRLAVYARQTAPLLTYYEERGTLIEVDGVGGPEIVAQRALDALGERGAA